MEKRLTLFELTAEMQSIEDALIESGGELTEELEARMAENAEALPAKVDGYHHIVRRLEAQGAAFKAMKDEFAGKEKVCTNSVKRIKEHLAGCMSQFGIKKLEGETATVTLRASEALEVDEAAALEPYADAIAKLRSSLPGWATVEVKVNKPAMKVAIAAGQPVSGAHAVTNYSAIIK